MPSDDLTRSTLAAQDSLAPPASGQVASAGDVIDGRYTIEAVLGQGAMGVVYRARERLLERPVAIKTIARELAGDPAFIRGFLEEARAMARIRHPNVVQLYTIGDEDELLYLAMEFIKGASLLSILDKHRDEGERLSLHNAVALLAEIIDGTGAIHEAGITHCDLKPANMVVEELTGRPVIIDFGLATSVETRHGTRAGSPAYMSPERAAGRPPTPQSDIYALGVTVYELLTGQLPYPARTRDEMDAMHHDLPIPDMVAVGEELAPFQPLVVRAMSKRPEGRFTSCEEMHAALVEARSHWGRRLSTPEIPTKEELDSNELRVLVVDDDPHFRRAAARAARLAFSDMAIRVLPASSGEQAVAIAERRMPSLILLDYELPELDGVATLSTIRSLPRGKDVRVAVISGTAEEMRWRFEALGVRHFLKKPVGLDELVATVQDNLRRR